VAGARTPPSGGARLIAGGVVGTDGIGAGGIGGPKMELPHWAKAGGGSHKAQIIKAACQIRQAPVESPALVMPAISTAIAAISSHQQGLSPVAAYVTRTRRWVPLSDRGA
jgi:hypothetical protein